MSAHSNIVDENYYVDDSGIISSGFLYWVNKTPQAEALFVSGKRFSYQELFQLSQNIYQKIKHLKDEIIGVQCADNIESYVNILAVSFLGAAYLPLNNKFPIERIAKISEDAKLKHVICFNDDFQKKLPNEVNIINLDYSLFSEINQIEHIDFSISNSQISYILYTSGSTGEPKGVPVSRKNINSFFNYYLNEYSFNNKDRFLQPYELSFDVSVFSMFCAWNCGASVYVVPDKINKPIEIIKMIRDNQLTVVSMVPGVLQLIEKYLSELHLPSVNYSFFSGDALKHDLAIKWKNCIPNAVIHNFYGPTETTIVCSRYEWELKKSEKESRNNTVPIGKLFANHEAVLLDENGNCFYERGRAGELCISGDQVIDSYLNNKDAHRFFKFHQNVFYKTGDWVELNEYGNFVFLGRTDEQVKINGFRVELTEIEQAIYEKYALTNKVIGVELNKIVQLVAFILKPADGLKTPNQFYLKLPSYMIPKKIIYINAFPLNPNGKIDRFQLKKIAIENEQ
jgi:amino acid adenylation domain-containing protein